MRRLLLTICTFLTLFSCSEKKEPVKDFKELEYIFIRRRGSLDTIYRETKYHFKSDTMDIITYKTIWNENVYEESFNFSKSKENIVNDTKLVENRIIEFEGQDYIIYKFLRDNIDMHDEEMFYFYSPRYGTLIEKAAWWGDYAKLTKYGNPEDNRIIYYLTEMITNNDKDFWINWK
jgi:hypothetical protein